MDKEECRTAKCRYGPALPTAKEHCEIDVCSVTEKNTPHSSKHHCHYSYASGHIPLTFLPLLVFSTLSVLTLTAFELYSLWLSYAEVLTAGKNVKRLAQPATGVIQKSGEWSVACNSI